MVLVVIVVVGSKAKVKSTPSPRPMTRVRQHTKLISMFKQIIVQEHMLNQSDALTYSF